MVSQLHYVVQRYNAVNVKPLSPVTLLPISMLQSFPFPTMSYNCRFQCCRRHLPMLLHITSVIHRVSRYSQEVLRDTSVLLGYKRRLLRPDTTFLPFHTFSMWLNQGQTPRAHASLEHMHTCSRGLTTHVKTC